MRRLLFTLLILAVGIGIYVYVANRNVSNVNSFADCEKAGYPIMESYPRQCRTPDGKSFTETLTPTQSAGIANPASVYCQEHGGVLSLQTDNTGTIGICKFSNGSQCEEWAYFRGECKQ